MAVMATHDEVLDLEKWRARLWYDEPLARHTTFRIGGPAELFVVAESEEELLALVRLARQQEMDFVVLGAASNVLVSDHGVSGLVIINRASEVCFTAGEEGSISFGAGLNSPTPNQRLGRPAPMTCPKANQPSLAPSLAERGPHREGADATAEVHVGSGASLSRLAHQAARRGLGGLEWAVGIPGTLGGAIVQNAGAHDSCMADVVLEVKILDQADLIRILRLEELAFSYRSSRFRGRRAENPPEVILSADLGLSPWPREELEARMTDYIAQRQARQPWLPSAGSVFKNPPGDCAGRLIEAAGLKGMRQGDAMIAPEHANFIVNVGSARASDVKALIDQTRSVVAQRFGVELELEIQMVGDWHGSCNSWVVEGER